MEKSSAGPKLQTSSRNAGSGESRSYKRTQGAADGAGEEFELQMLMLVYLRLLDSGSEFYIGSNVAAARPFDDIVIKDRANSEEPWSTAMLQLKHKKESKVTSRDVLLTLKDDFSLVKFCESYSNMKSSNDEDLKFLGDFSDFQFVILTNSKFKNIVKTKCSVEAEIVKPLHRANIESKFDEDDEVIYFAEESHFYQQLCEWNDLRDVLCQINKQIRDRPVDDVSYVIKVMMSELPNFTNHAVKFTVQGLTKSPTIEKLTETIKNLNVIQEKDLLKDFLSHLQLYTNQSQGTNLVNLIKQHLNKTCKFTIDSDADKMFLKLTEDVRWWWKNKNTYLTQNSRIWLDIIKAHINQISAYRMQVLRQYKVDFTDVSVDKMHREIPWTNGGILNVIVDSRTTASSIKMMAALDRFGNVKNILFVDVATLLHREDEIIGLWSSRWCRVLVVECDTELDQTDVERISNKIVNMIEGNVLRRMVILIGQDGGGLTKNFCHLGYSQFKDNCEWSQLSETSQENLLQYEIKLQGSAISLKTLMNGQNKFLDEVNGDVISHLLSGETCCGKELEPINDVFVRRRLLPFDGKVFPVKSVSDVNEKVVLIGGGPGMGQTTLITQLALSAKAEYPMAWVLHIKLKDCVEHLATMDLKNLSPNAAMKLLEKVSLKSENCLEVALFRSLENNFIVFVDDFDEVCSHYEQQALEVLQCLSNLKIRQLWVTSPPNLQHKLASIFTVKAFVLDSFSPDDQSYFIIEKSKLKFPNAPYNNLKIHAEKMIEVCSSSLGGSNSILSVPLMAAMAVDVFEESFHNGNYNIFETKLDRLSLYIAYMKKKCELYFNIQEMGKDSFVRRAKKYIFNDAKHFNQKFHNIHQQAALRLLFGNDNILAAPFAGSSTFETKFIEEVRRGGRKIGIIDSISVNGTPHFVHRTFADYFAASWLFDNFKTNKEFVILITFNPLHAWIRDMFNRFLAKGHPIHTAILESDSKEVDRLLYDRSIFSWLKDYGVDAGGRTPLHLAVLLTGTECGLGILWLLLQHKALVDVADKVLGWRPLQYADRVQAWTAAGMILAAGGNEEDMPTIMSIKQPTRQAFIAFVKKSLPAAPDTSLMLAAARDAGLPIVRYLVEERRGDVHCRGSRGETMLHMAAEGGDVELLEYLYAIEPPLCDEDSEYLTPLNYAARESQAVAVRFLLRARNVHGCPRGLGMNYHDRPEQPIVTLDDGMACLVKGDEEHIVGLRDSDGRVYALQLAMIRAPIGNPGSFAKIVIQGCEYLYIHDEDGFIGYGNFTENTYLKELAVSSIDRAKEAILKCFQIHGIVQDRLSESRDASLAQWKRQMELVVAKKYYFDVKEINEMLKKFSSGTDMQILKYIASNSSLPVELKSVSRELFDIERKFVDRNAKLGCLCPTLLRGLRLSGVHDFLRAKYNAAIENHYLLLTEVANDAGQLRNRMEQSLSKLQFLPMVLLINCQDIELFKSLESAAKRFCVGDQLAGTLQHMWDKFVENATMEKTSKKLTTPVYQYLFISFLETVTELQDKTFRKMSGSADSLLQVQENSFQLNSIHWPDNTRIQDRALEKESRFLVHIMNHAQPGVELTSDIIISCKTCNLNHKENEAGGNGSIEPLIWTTVLENTMHFLLTESQSENDGFIRSEYKKLLTSLEEAYSSYVSVCGSSESCRVTARNIVRFAAQMYDHKARVTRPCDAEVLQSQAAFMRFMMDFQKHGTQFAEDLPRLIAEFVRYWENRKDFDIAVSSNFTHSSFIEEIQRICNDIHATLREVLIKTKMSPDMILDYLRLFNEFLTTFQHINFVWLVQIDPNWDADLGLSYRKTVTGKNTSYYEVTDQKAFVAELTAANLTIPKHYVLAIARRLTDLVFRSLVHGACNEQTRVRGTGNLLEAIRKAFIHLDDQIDYQSFEQFERDLCQPFESVAVKMDQYADFKRHLDNLENFFVYTRKQNEIDIDKALLMFQQKTGNTGIIDNDVLKESFLIYDKAFNLNISQHYNKGVDILQTIKSSFPVKDHSQWETAFRRQRIPELLAAVSAFWSIGESVHVIDTGNSIKPHCIQILCVLRLLNVDQDGGGLRKHLAEVLTGQGKSLVLGLLASVLALTGHSVQIVCYSEYLAKRDQQAFEDFFKDLGIRDKVDYGTFDNLAFQVLHINMHGGVHYIRDVLQKMVLDELPASRNVGETDGIKRPSILLVDEVDVFFTNEFYGNTYGMCINTGMHALLEIQVEIWKRVCKMQDAKSIFTDIQELVTTIFAEKMDTKFSNFYEKSKIWFGKQLSKMIDDAFIVHNEKANENLFMINENGEIAFRRSDGLYSLSTVRRYENVFNYLRLKQDSFDHKNYHNYGYLNIHCGCVSYAELPKEYPVILGVSGTISTLSSEEMAVVRDSYGIEDVSCMPTFFGKVSQVFYPCNNFQIADDEKKWQDAILKSVRDKQKVRAVIVFFDTELEIDKFTERFKNDLPRFTKLTGNEGSTQMERRIKDAGVVGSLTLALRAMGRGVDYRSSLTVEQNGGVHVVQTFLSLDVKEETQIKGRTARKDNKGSYELILCRQQLIAEGFLTSKDGVIDYETLHGKRLAKAAEKYKRNGENVSKALEKHNLSLEVIKSLETYHPDLRSSYLSRYPFVRESQFIN